MIHVDNVRINAFTFFLHKKNKLIAFYYVLIL